MMQLAHRTTSRFLVQYGGSATPAPQCRCAACGVRSQCVSSSLTEFDLQRFDAIVSRRRLERGQVLYRMGDPFSNLYAIRLGHFKSHQMSVNGAEQITGFQMAGELMGLDAIGNERHNCFAVALEDGEVCEIPFDRLEQLCFEIPELLRHFHRTMSQEIRHNKSAILLLGKMQAEQRLATFLVDLSSRYKAHGYSPTRFQLRMSRDDIGNYLGLTVESVSRLLFKFKTLQLITVDKREIELRDLPHLKWLATQTAGQADKID